MQSWIINLAYLVASLLFILGLKGLTRPRTAVRGNILGAIGMLVAVVATLLNQEVVDFSLIAIGVGVGGLIGAVWAIKVQMTAMPQLVAMFNGFGGAASALVAAAELTHTVNAGAAGDASGTFAVSTMASALIGGVTFTGSMVAFAKLQGILRGGAIRLPAHHLWNIVLTGACVALSAWAVFDLSLLWVFWAMAGLSLVLGVMLVIPIGGADMPVVIALLNSLSGIAAAATGFVLMNNALVIAGSLVGASGLILTAIMCKAMNRSVWDVLFGQFGGNAEGPSADDVYAGKVKSTSAEELAMLLETARQVMVVPGYGMAVAQAQHAVRDLANLLGERGVEVTFGIHPVAGRMPGHMNVLLAEADIPYEQLLDDGQANSALEQTDVVFVIGANDVVNPVARTDSTSPIYGMPIIDVDKARTVVVIKRSLSPGFAGIPNPLFAADHTLMYFGDAKKAVMGLVSALKDAA